MVYLKTHQRFLTIIYRHTKSYNNNNNNNKNNNNNNNNNNINKNNNNNINNNKNSYTGGKSISSQQLNKIGDKYSLLVLYFTAVLLPVE